MKKICVCITAFRRPESLSRLINQIDALTERLFDYAVHIKVFHDGHYSDFGEWIMNRDIELFIYKDDETGENHGKRKYWLFIDKLFKTLKAGKDYDYYYMLPDDAILLPNFFTNSLAIWEAITDDKKACLNLYIDENRYMIKQWGIPVKAEMKGFGSHAVIKTGWVDMEMMFTKDFLKALDYKMEKVTNRHWERNEAIGSGVGEQISWRLYHKGLNLYQCCPSLALDDYHPSVMNAGRPKDSVPMVSLKDRNSKVIFGIATIYRRRNWLYDTIRSLEHQCDEIHVYLDNYMQPTVPDDYYVNPRCKIIYHNSFDTQYPLGSSGKFYGFIGKENAYCFTADDDLIYPADYVHKMITRIEVNNRKYVVCAMGSYCHQGIENYWEGRVKYNLFREQPKYQVVNVPGTGVTAFHTDTLQLNRSDFVDKEYKGTLTLSDIWFASVLKEKKAQALLVPHKSKWIDNNQAYDDADSLFQRTKDNGEAIAEMLNKYALA